MMILLHSKEECKRNLWIGLELISNDIIAVIIKITRCKDYFKLLQKNY